MIIQILRLNRRQQRPKPLEAAKVPAYPEEIHFPEPRLLFGVIHAIPHTLQDTRKRRNSNPGTDKDGNLVFKDILGGATEGAVEVDAGEDTAYGGVAVRLLGVVVEADNLGFVVFVVLKVAANGFGKGFGEAANAADVYREVVLLGGACEGERVVLPYRYFRTT